MNVLQWCSDGQTATNILNQTDNYEYIQLMRYVSKVTVSTRRGVVAVESLKAIEQATGKPIYELFDLICGSSTGAILSFLLSFRYLPLNVCNDIYRSISLETFKQNSIVGRGKLFMNYSYYDTQAWEMTLR